MYACIPENGGGYFEGLCPPSSATADIRDPPPVPRFANRLRETCPSCPLGLSLGRIAIMSIQGNGGLFTKRRVRCIMHRTPPGGIMLMASTLCRETRVG
jgi:hypothetical protein